jgi:hypothetical protein
VSPGSLPPAARSKELTFAEIAGEVVCAGVSCAEAGIKVIADVTTSDIKIEDLVISAPHNKHELNREAALPQPFNKLD